MEERNCFQHLVGQSFALWTKEKRIAYAVRNQVVPLGASYGEGKEAAVGKMSPAILPRTIHDHGGIFSVVQSRTAQPPIIKLKSQRFHQM